jgi:hypothetical protein
MLVLFDGDFGAADGFAGEAADFACLEGYDAFASGVNGEVAAEFGAFAGALSQADLADDNLSNSGLLAAGHLNTKPLAGAVLNVLYCSTCFDV